MSKGVLRKGRSVCKRGTGRRLARDARTSGGAEGTAASTSTAAAAAAATISVAEPVQLQCPALKRVDSSTLTHCNAVLASADENCVAREDLDALQLELESLLTAVSLRLRQLSGQLSVLSELDTRGGRKSRGVRHVIAAPAPTSAPPVPRTSSVGSPSVVPPISLLPKKSNGPAPSGFSPPPRKRSKLIKKRPDVNLAAKPQGRGKGLEKDFIINKFWGITDPYCEELTEDNVRLLKSILNHNQTEVPAFLEIPSLGEHFSMDWEMKELIENHSGTNGSSAIAENAVGINSLQSSVNNSIGSTVKRKLRECSAALKRQLRTSVEKSIGPSSSRLLAALTQDTDSQTPAVSPLQESKDSNVIVKTEKDEEEKASTRQLRLNSLSCSVNNTENQRKHQKGCLERKSRLDQEAQGALDFSVREQVGDDSLLGELKRSQAELKVITEQNNAELAHLTNLVLEELKVQNLRRKLRKADAVVIDLYHSRMAAKLQKQVITKRDVDMAWKAIRDREQILRQLDFFERKWLTTRALMGNDAEIKFPTAI